jgi:hypothetical protein
MITVKILEASDIVEPTDWVRPLYLFSGDGEVHTTSTYGGRPINNLKWLPVYSCLAPRWHGKSVADVESLLGPHEFMRGPLPKEHQHPDQRPVPGYTPVR